MERRNSLVVIFLAAVLGSAAIAPRSTVPASTALVGLQSHNQTERSSAPLRACTAAGVVREFFSGNYKSQDKGPDEIPDATIFGGVFPSDIPGVDSFLYEEMLKQPDDCTGASLDDDLKKIPPGWTIDSLIATVPDLIESGLPSQFDDYVDTIERAVSADRFIPDRFYNPWPYPHQVEAKAGEDTSDTQSDVDEDSPAEGQKVPPYERNPGLILLRDIDQNQKKLLVVLLVGETPTAGVHKGAFESALQQAYELFKYNSKAQTGEPANQVKIVGPTFSGSTTSMNNAIDEWRVSGEGHSCPIEIISGSANAVTGKEFSTGVSFQTTIVSIFSQVEALLGWLGRPDGKNVAVLSEENTFFGSWHRNDRYPQNDLLLFRFPLHIAELQAAAQRAAERAKGESSTLPSLTLSNLPIDPQEMRSRRDLIPLYSNFEINSLELVLESTLREIDEHEISYVIIAGTDPADTLFLIHWLRQNCPRVTPIALGADLRYLHTDFNSDTRGMIIASSYPLYLENQLLTRKQNRPGSAIQFSTEGSEGTYNAVRWLVSKPDGRLLDYTKPFASKSDDSSCKPSEAHPLWISMVGADQIWPLSIEDAPVPEGYPADYMVPISPTGVDDVTDNEFKFYPKSFVIICFLILLGCCVVLSLIVVNRIGDPEKGFGPIWIQQVLSRAVLPEYSEPRHTQVLLLSTVLFGMFATAA